LIRRIAAAALIVIASSAAAQSWPTKPVRLIVPYPPGGLTDVLARGLAVEIQKVWGQPLVVENRPGASQMIGAEAIARAAPDGYTIGMLDKTPLAINPFLFRKLAYDPLKDFQPIMNLVQTSQVLVVNPSVKAGTLQEFIAAAKEKPGSINYGTFGPGSITHLDTEALSRLAGIKLTHIPYKGIAEVLPAVMSGQIQMALSGIPPTLPHIKSGKLKALAVASDKRLPVLPDVPTFAEAGVDLSSNSWFGLFGPAGLPKPIVDRIVADFGRILSQEEFDRKFVSGVGLENLNHGTEQFAAAVAADRKKYEQYVKPLNIRLD
jgi:tripartite-type tricarboxylate transporter receptor subunit TctC